LLPVVSHIAKPVAIKDRILIRLCVIRYLINHGVEKYYLILGNSATTNITILKNRIGGVMLSVLASSRSWV